MTDINTLRRGTDAVVRQPASPVPTDTITHRTQLAELVATMRTVMHEANGVGLAAPQIGRSMQVAVISYNDTELAWANPVIEASGGEDTALEGCLSLPDQVHRVARSEWVTVRAFNIDTGTSDIWELSGWVARIAQHEIDHLNGLLIDHTGTQVLT
jgi:peptide deformylase